MAVMAREKWTDERLDDLTQRVDRGFDESKLEVRDLRSDMNKGFDESKLEVRDLRSDMNKGFDRVDADIRELRAEIGGLRSDTNTEIGTLRAEMKKGFDAVNARFDVMQQAFASMQRAMLIGFVTLFASIAATVIGGILATQL